MNLLNLELDAGADWGLTQPHEEIDVFVAVEEKIVVATALKAEIIDHIADSLAFKLGLDLCVGDQVDNVFDELTEHIADAVGRKYHSSLAILPLLAIGIRISKRVQFVLRQN